jgi:N-acyl-D-amino-acid deacylase
VRGHVHQPHALEGDALLESLDELIAISRATGAPAEIYHMKASAKDNWPKLPAAIARIEAARREGLRINANMYTYPAASTGLDPSVAMWVQAFKPRRNVLGSEF